MEEELLGSFADSIKGSLTKQTKDGTVYNEGNYSNQNTLVGEQFKDLNPYDAGLKLGMDQNANRADNTNYKFLRAVGRLPRNILGEVLTTVGAGVQLGTNPINTLSGEMGEIHPLADWLMTAGKELSQGDSMRMFDLYTDESGVFDPGDGDWWAKTVEGWGPTFGMMIASMGTGAAVKLGTTGITKAIAGQMGKQMIKSRAKSVVKKEAAKLARDYIKVNLPKATTALQRKAVKNAAKALQRKTIREGMEELASASRKKVGSDWYKRNAIRLPYVQNAQGAARTISTSLVSRNAETFGESKQTYDIVLARSKQQHPEWSEEQHKQEASQAAAKNYQRGMMLMLIDMYQYSKLFKGFDKGAKEINKSLWKKASNYFAQGFSEGGEEVLQYSISKEAQQANQIFGDDTVLETMLNSWRDKEFQESFVQGALGGIMFQGAGDIYSMITKAKSKKAEAATNTEKATSKELEESTKTEKSTKEPKGTPADIETGDGGLPDDVETGTINLGTPNDDLDVDAPDNYVDDVETGDAEQGVPDDLELGDSPMGLPDDIELGDAPEMSPDDVELFEEAGFPDEYLGPTEIPDGVDGEHIALSDTFAENPDLAQQANDELGTNFNGDRKNDVQEQIKLERKQIQEEVKVMRDELKASHPETHKLAEAHIMRNAINSNTTLTSDQKKALREPHTQVINEFKEKGKTIKDAGITGYSDHRKTAAKVIENKVKELNVDKVDDIKDQDITDVKTNKLIELSQRPNLSEEGKQELIDELQSRKPTPEIKRALQQLTQEPITEEKVKELEVDNESMIGRALIAIVNKIGNSVNVQEGKLGYNYETNVLSFPKGATDFDKVITIAKELAKQNDPVVKEIEKVMSDKEINIPFVQVIDQIFNDTDFAISLMNIPSDTKTKSLLDIIFDALMKVLGIKNNNLFNETLAQFYKAIAANYKPEVVVNTNLNIPDGQITNIVSPYMMLTYEAGEAKHNGKKVTIEGKRKPYIVVNKTKYFVDPGYKSNLINNKRVTILLDESYQPATNSLYTKDEIRRMKEDIPYKAELDLRIEKDTGPDTSLVGLYYNNRKIGVLPGWFANKPNKALKQLRQDIYDRHINKQPLGTVTFDGSTDNIIRTSQDLSWDKALPSNQMDKPKIGVITKVDKEMSELSGLPVGTKIIQFNIDSYVPYNGNQPQGHPVMYVKNARGTSVPIQGETVIFADNQDAQDKLFDIINNTPEDKLQEAVWSMIKWTDKTQAGYGVRVPIVRAGFREANLGVITEPKEGDYIVAPDHIKDGKLQLGMSPIKVKSIKGNNIELDNGVNKVMVTLQELKQLYKLHPYTNFMNKQSIWSKPIQMDRNKMSNKKYLEERKDYMKFNVTPGVFGVPERKIIMKLNVPSDVVNTQQQDSDPIVPESIIDVTQEEKDTSNISKVQKFALGKKQAERDGTEYKEISSELIDLEQSGLDDLAEDDLVIEKVIVLEQRGLNFDGVPSGKVRIQFSRPSDGSTVWKNIDVKFKKEKTKSINITREETTNVPETIAVHGLTNGYDVYANDSNFNLKDARSINPKDVKMLYGENKRNNTGVVQVGSYLIYEYENQINLSIGVYDWSQRAGNITISLPKGTPLESIKQAAEKFKDTYINSDGKITTKKIDINLVKSFFAEETVSETVTDPLESTEEQRLSSRQKRMARRGKTTKADVKKTEEEGKLDNLNCKNHE